MLKPQKDLKDLKKCGEEDEGWLQFSWGCSWCPGYKAGIWMLAAGSIIVVRSLIHGVTMVEWTHTQPSGKSARMFVKGRCWWRQDTGWRGRAGGRTHLEETSTTTQWSDREWEEVTGLNTHNIRKIRRDRLERQVQLMIRQEESRIDCSDYDKRTKKKNIVGIAFVQEDLKRRHQCSFFQIGGFSIENVGYLYKWFPLPVCPWLQIKPKPRTTLLQVIHSIIYSWVLIRFGIV